MKVKELIEELGKYDPEAEVHRVTDGDWLFGDTTEVDEVYESTVQYGLLLAAGPTTVKTVVLSNAAHGL